MTAIPVEDPIVVVDDSDARAAAALLKSTQHVVFWVDRRDTQVPAKEPIDWECP